MSSQTWYGTLTKKHNFKISTVQTKGGEHITAKTTADNN
jgi:hypothetical protein